MRKPLQNVGASVRARLLNLAKERNQPFELLLVRYTLERLLYRLSTSKHRENFALKGAMLMRHWLDDPHRPTRDLDLLGFGDSDPKLTLNLFREICAIEADDAVVFDIDGLAVDTVRDESGYSGLRLKTYATVDGARVRVVIDIGYGDATEPGLIDIDLPVLLDQPAPNVRAYSYETVIAEKFQAMVALGLANTRLKDFYDIWILTQAYEFNDDRLAQAIAATFARRKTVIPIELPDWLTPAFARDPAKQQQWAAFVQEFAVNPGPLPHVVKTLATFLMAHAGKLDLVPRRSKTWMAGTGPAMTLRAMGDDPQKSLPSLRRQVLSSAGSYDARRRFSLRLSPNISFQISFTASRRCPVSYASATIASPPAS